MTNKLTDLIAPSFYDLHNYIKNNTYSEYFIKGGRGSTKSSCVSLEIIFMLEKDPEAHALILRDTSSTLRTSVYEQICWAINKLGLEDQWIFGYSPLEIRRKGTDQRIKFAGASDPNKIKSIKTNKGYFKVLWFEEADCFRGMEELRKVSISVARGTNEFVTFLTYNPPNNPYSWINKEVLVPLEGRLVHTSNYLSVPKDWLGLNFIRQAAALKKVNLLEYQHTYLGDVVGTGRQVFNNLNLRHISVDEILCYDQVRMGIDWGFSPDPFVFIKAHYDRARRELYIFEEFTITNLTNQPLINHLKTLIDIDDIIVADCAEKKSIADFVSSGIDVRPCTKSKDSPKYGVDFLRSLSKIHIDPVKCPLAAEEFSLYELLVDRNNDLVLQYSTKNNHTIDAIRYALEWDIPQRGRIQFASGKKDKSKLLTDGIYEKKLLGNHSDLGYATAKKSKIFSSIYKQ